MAYVEIQAGLAALKSAGDILKALYEAKLTTDVQTKVGDSFKLIIDARETVLNLQTKLSEIESLVSEKERQIAEFTKWGEDKKRYKLFQPNNLQSVTYGLSKSQACSEPPHYLCANCYSDSRKAILNNSEDKDRWTMFSCPKCKAVIPTGCRGRVLPEYAPE